MPEIINLKLKNILQEITPEEEKVNKINDEIVTLEEKIKKLKGKAKEKAEKKLSILIKRKDNLIKEIEGSEVKNENNDTTQDNNGKNEEKPGEKLNSESNWGEIKKALNLIRESESEEIKKSKVYDKFSDPSINRDEINMEIEEIRDKYEKKRKLLEESTIPKTKEGIEKRREEEVSDYWNHTLGQIDNAKEKIREVGRLTTEKQEKKTRINDFISVFIDQKTPEEFRKWVDDNQDAAARLHQRIVEEMQEDALWKLGFDRTGLEEYKERVERFYTPEIDKIKSKYNSYLNKLDGVNTGGSNNNIEDTGEEAPVEEPTKIPKEEEQKGTSVINEKEIEKQNKLIDATAALLLASAERRKKQREEREDLKKQLDDLIAYRDQQVLLEKKKKEELENSENLVKLNESDFSGSYPNYPEYVGELKLEIDGKKIPLKIEEHIYEYIKRTKLGSYIAGEPTKRMELDNPYWKVIYNGKEVICYNGRDEALKVASGIFNTEKGEDIKKEKEEISLDKEEKPMMYFAIEKSKNKFLSEVYYNKITQSFDLRKVEKDGVEREFRSLKRTGENEGFFDFNIYGFFKIIKNVKDIKSEDGSLNIYSEKAKYKIIGPDGKIIKDNIDGYTEANIIYKEETEKYKQKVAEEFNNLKNNK